MNKKIGISILTVMLLFGTAYSQQIEEKIEITFNLNGYVVDPAIDINVESMQTLNDIVKRVETDSLFSITSITVDSYASPEGDSYASPEGDSYYNQKLSARRSMSMYNYLRDELSIADSLITVSSRGVAWERLRAMVVASDMANRDEVIDIIDNIPNETWRRINPTDRWQTLVDSRNKHLMDLRGGRPYKYMQQTFFPKLRSGSIVTIYYRRPEAQILEGEAKIITPELELPALTESQTEAIREATKVDPPIITRPYIALKTNLLFDAATLANIELEIPVAQRWSVAAEWMFPWWLWENKQNCIQMLSGSLEARYWIKPNNKYLRYTPYNPLAGWFVGLYGGGGLYDLERNKVGYQGEFYIATGVSAGYVHPFSKSLLMEFSVGVGYINTDYRKYEAQYSNVDNDWHLIRQYNGSQTWIGPTKAKISLVWYPHFKKRGGER